MGRDGRGGGGTGRGGAAAGGAGGTTAGAGGGGGGGRAAREKREGSEICMPSTDGERLCTGAVMGEEAIVRRTFSCETSWWGKRLSALRRFPCAPCTDERTALEIAFAREALISPSHCCLRERGRAEESGCAFLWTETAVSRKSRKEDPRYP